MCRPPLALAALPVLAACLTLSPVVAIAGEGTEAVLAPVSTWEASIDGSLCRMERRFGSEAQPHLMIVEQNGPGAAVGLALAGPSLQGLVPDKGVALSFAKDQPGIEGPASIEPNRQFGAVAILRGVRLFSAPAGGEAGGPPKERARIDLAAAERVEQVSLSQGPTKVTFATGPLGDAAQVLNQCTAQVLRTWGLDPEVQYGVQPPPLAKDQAGLVKEVHKAYPRSAARALRQGVLDVVLVTDAAGVATNCKLMVTTSYADLDASMCQTLMKQRFEPARGADGQPVASFWRTRITLRVG